MFSTSKKDGRAKLHWTPSIVRTTKAADFLKVWCYNATIYLFSYLSGVHSYMFIFTHSSFCCRFFGTSVGCLARIRTRDHLSASLYSAAQFLQLDRRGENSESGIPLPPTPWPFLVGVDSACVIENNSCIPPSCKLKQSKVIKWQFPSSYLGLLLPSPS